jgi:uncharacterized membrane protein YcaP (DUF421 family)
MDAVGLFLQDLFVPGTSLAEKIIRPVAVYLFLVLILRIGGRRELAQMNAFDLVVLLTLSNAVQNAIIGDDNSLIGGFIGGGTLVLLNVIVVRFLYRHPGLESQLEGQPIPLVKDGRVVRENLAHELITADELLAAVHRQGVTRIEDCAEVILETSGTVSVIPRSPTPVEGTLAEISTRLERLEAALEKIASAEPAGRANGAGPAT